MSNATPICVGFSFFKTSNNVFVNPKTALVLSPLEVILGAFKNAKCWSNAAHWDWAVYPNAREKASFLKENILPIQESGQLELVEVSGSIDGKLGKTDFAESISVRFVSGHTESMMLPQVQYKGRTLVYMADLLPSQGHIPIPYVMGYDTRPLITLTEKEQFLTKVARENYYLFLEHDAHNQLITVVETERGVRLNEVFRTDDVF
mgnify:CR=1 FL=1